VFSNITNQLTLYRDNKKYYIFDINLNNKIIEYNGDFWHANPTIYNESFINKRLKKTAQEIWDKDQNKIQFAKDQGYNVLVVWEHDFKNNKQKVIDECITFLKQ